MSIYIKRKELPYFHLFVGLTECILIDPVTGEKGLHTIDQDIRMRINKEVFGANPNEIEKYLRAGENRPINSGQYNTIIKILEEAGVKKT